MVVGLAFPFLMITGYIGYLRIYIYNYYKKPDEYNDLSTHFLQYTVTKGQRELLLLFLMNTSQNMLVIWSH